GVEKIYLTPFSALAPAVAIATTGLALGYMGEAMARALNPLLWTKGTGEQYGTTLRRFFAPDKILLVSSALMLLVYFLVPWFSITGMERAATAQDVTALLASGA